MRKVRTTALLALVLAPAACGSSPSTNTFQLDGSSPGDASVGDGGVGPGSDSGLVNDGGLISQRTVVGLTISPATASIESLNQAPATQTFSAVAKWSDGTSSPVTGASWSRDNPQVGAIDGSGLYTASGAQGGTVNITATINGQTATASLQVKLHMVAGKGKVPTPVQTKLTGAKTADAQVVWAYPYDATVFPQGIGEAPLMWLHAGASDLYYVHLTSPAFELEAFTPATDGADGGAGGSGRYDFSALDWQNFTNSTSGAATLEVARWDGTNATVAVHQSWTVAPGSMRGTIYYWAINTGRVMRIQPGATAPDDFLGPTVTCPSCHTVSANGQNLLMNEGNWPSETSFNYDLQASSTSYSGFAVTTGASQWALPGISPDGTVVVENFAPLRGPIGTQTGAFDAKTAAQIPSTGLEGHELFMPAFSPDGQLLAYVDSASGDLHAYDWDQKTRKATGDRLIVAASANATYSKIQFPTVSPDHKWIVYGRGTALGSLGTPGDLYAASVTKPGTEINLGSLNGTGYPFAAGSRDLDLDYEPTFAPVPAGGYFWIVFHSRRTFGNAITGPAYVAEGNGVKQLWVAAFDQSPMAGKDPSHSAFYLPGQDPATLNMRGYWALSPCEGNGKGCQSGVDCCGGYCAPGNHDGGLVCSSTSSGCSANGDKCTTASDCCGASGGVTCINSVCAAPPPQ